MQTKRFDVLVVGELNVDIILNEPEKFPELGKEILAAGMLLTMGSSSAIFACNLRTLATSVAFAGRIGQDDFAHTILSTFQKRGVSCDYIIRSQTAKTGATVALNFGEDRAMITYPGAMDELSGADITDTMLHSARHLHVSSVFLQKSLKPDLVPLFRRAKELGLTTSLDTQWDPQEKWDLDLPALLPHVDVFLPNSAELENLTGVSDILLAVNQLKSFANVIVVKDGSNGAYLWDTHELYKQPAFLNRQVADAIGAGDSFDAGFICKYICHQPLRDCLEYATLMGAVNTTHFGGTTAFESLDTVKTIARQHFNYTVE